MKIGDTIYAIHRDQGVIEGELGDETTAQGFYTRWGEGHQVLIRSAANSAMCTAYNDEDIFSTKVAATKEVFTRRLRYPNLMKGRAA